MTEQAAMGKLTMRANVRGAATKLRKRTFFLEFTVVFAVVALVLGLVGGFALTTVLGNDIRNKTLDDVEMEVSEVTAPLLSSRLTAEQLQSPLSGAELAAFDRFVNESILNSHTIRVNVWSTDGTIVYSSHAPLTGASFQNDELGPALNGEVSARVGSDSLADEPERAGLEGFDDIVEVYVPLTMGDPPETVGVAEIYRDYAPIAAHIGSIQKSVFISVAAVLAILYLLLVALVRRGSNTIRRQQADLQGRTSELKTSYDSIVAVLCAALDLRDNVTHGHAKRVSELASVVAWQMGLRKEQLRQIEKAAILHDIGKIGVADVVLSKPGPLNDFEWAEMKRHPELGWRILSGIDFLRDAAEVVYAHHERFDGTGYPRGLKGDEIPLGARIFAVVDAYDAMTSHRPYRKALPHLKAIEEIARNAGSQFDPEVVRAFLEAEKRGPLDLGHGDGDGQKAPTAVRASERTLSSARD
jgi:HD-GYP domain-containing protein (c-di-GMP phosphodiesterase class II)